MNTLLVQMPPASRNYLTDALGSTVALTNSAGSSTVQYSYGPFGNISITGTTTNSFTYTGREIDGLGINYYRARYYNPQIGRFLSEDPIGFAGGINQYAYVDDDPLNFVDRFGLATTVHWPSPPPSEQRRVAPVSKAFRVPVKAWAGRVRLANGLSTSYLSARPGAPVPRTWGPGNDVGEPGEVRSRSPSTNPQQEYPRHA